MKITLVAAIASNNVIGKENSLPWNIPEDLKRFKQMTSGHTILMGRKTFDSIGRPLPNRQNIVMTKNDIRARKENYAQYEKFCKHLNLYSKIIKVPITVMGIESDEHAIRF